MTNSASQKIKIVGSGGQGVKFLSHMLGQILISKNYQVGLIYDYDAAVRGGDISSELTFSKNKIANPFSEEIDFLINFKKNGKEIKANQIFDFSDGILEKVAIEKFGDKRLFNMIILGAILKILNIDIKTIKVDNKFKEAIKYGYENYCSC